MTVRGCEGVHFALLVLTRFTPIKFLCPVIAHLASLSPVASKWPEILFDQL